MALIIKIVGFVIKMVGFARKAAITDIADLVRSDYENSLGEEADYEFVGE